MSKIPKSLLALVLILALKLTASDNNDFTFNGFNGSNMTLNGIAEIESNGLLRLTNGSEQGFGHAFYPIPLNFKNLSHGNVSSFTTTFIFCIYSDYKDLSGHGMAFTISPTTELVGASAGRYLGLFNPSNNGNSSNHVFAVEFDTIFDSEFEDIGNNHVGIDINSLKSNRSAPASYININGENKNISLMSGKPIQVWVVYNGVEKQLNVTISPITEAKPNKPLLSLNIDLSPVLLESMYVGFSSATGSMRTRHYLLGWSFNLNGEAQQLDHSKLPSLPQGGSSKGIAMGGKIGIPLASVVLILIVILGTLYVIRKKRYAEIYEEWELEYGPPRFPYKDLYKATKGFRDKYLLGKGGFGRVYKGAFPSNNSEVAVKRLSHDSEQGLREFVAEIATLGRLRHRNLVPLLGYCRRMGELLLVYDFMANGSLDRFIYHEKKSMLNWDLRFKILKGVARGLLYLHEEWEQIVIHRDVKASNVLIDADFNGRLGDFGLARLHNHGSNPQTTLIVGTLGYMAPELSRTGKGSTSTDVFAFGALLLEVACGRRPIDHRESSEKLVLVDFVHDCWMRGVILESRDVKLGSAYPLEEMELVLKLGLLCSHPVPTARPSMRQVMQFLDKDVALPAMALADVGSDGFVGLDHEGYDNSCSYSSSMELPR